MKSLSFRRKFKFSYFGLIIRSWLVAMELLPIHK